MKKKIEWTSALRVGVADIDEQHQRLYGIIDNIMKAQEKGLGDSSLLALLAQMADYSEYHFRTEDNYMIENNYPDFLPHRKEHLAYLKKMSEYIKAVENKDEFSIEDILDYLGHWWQTHITESDLKYACYMAVPH